ncbi:MAG: DUF512 domain-containing protein [Clostridia bacterium]|nr:DUF512 domain-containing protein [Clostridia bacterium]
MDRQVRIIERIRRGSVAKKAGLMKGDEILTLQGYPFVDEMDLAFYEQEEALSFTVLRDGKKLSFAIEKEEWEPLGIEMRQSDYIIPCKNNCLFCFVRQLPKGMRETLYVKDDDYRMSFAMGSYVTLSNITDEEIERIKRLGLSPLYISVHCYTKELKRKICKNPRSAELFSILEELAAAHITMHTQIVMMEGINDGEELKLTIRELAKLYPYVKTVAVVPVGLTKHREGLPALKPIGKENAEQSIKWVEAFNADMIEKHQEPFAFCSDEMYLIAGKEVPPYSSYGAFEQVENGVGLVADFFHEADLELASGVEPKGEYSAITGMSFAPLLRKYAKRLEELYDVKVDVCPVRNDFFGESVTVSGLVTGGDIIKQYKGKLRKDVIIPRTMLREFSGVFLDEVTICQLEEALGVCVHVADGGAGFIDILGGEK